MTEMTGQSAPAVRSGAHSKRAVQQAVLVAALGYFVDIYDLILFSIVRVSSLKAIGVPDAQLLDSGVLLINMQMGGMLVGGILWGILGDKRGRLSVLFGSIILYSLANIANGFVQNIEQYAALRLIAGIGLAGELGAGITLVSEIMHKESRGYGTTVIATVGLLGAVVAALVGDLAPWRTAYFIGGGLGIALLLLRVGVRESGMFERIEATKVGRGDFFSLFTTRARVTRYVSIILVAVPIWFVTGILITFSPEFAKALHLPEAPTVARAVMFDYIGLAIGDLVSGLLSQHLRSRKEVLVLFLGMMVVSVVLYFTVGMTSRFAFYAVCFALGFSSGYWAVFVTMASEQFGTNIRSTATTTAPNFVRGAVVPMTSLFQIAKGPMGVPGAGIAVGVLVLFIAFLSLRGLQETFGKDLDYVDD